MWKLPRNSLALLVTGLLLASLLAACGADPTIAPPSGTPGANINNAVNTPTASAATTAAATTSAVTTAATTVASQTTVAAVPTNTTSPTTVAATATSAVTAPAIQKAALAKFAPYQEAQVNTKATFPKYSVSANLSNVTNLGDFKLSDGQKKLLGQNYFVVSPSEYKQFFQAYESFRYDQIPTYVSTDSVTNVYHMLFDKLLRETENGYLIQDLILLNKALYDASVKQYDALVGTSLEAAATRNVAFFAVARELADPATNLAVPSYASQMVEDQLKAIAEASGKAPSPVMGGDYEEDYTQYTPRGHYTKSEQLKNYFKAMIWYGRITFRAENASETASALLLTQAILTGQNGTQKASDLWKLIYEPTAFFVGDADDLTYQDYANVIKAVYGNAGLSDPKALTDQAKLAVAQKGIDALPPPKLNSMITYTTQDLTTQTKGLRVMGQRFTIDGSIFQALLWRNVGTDAKPRLLPSGLDIFGVLGSSEATKLLAQQGATQYQNYQTAFDSTKKQVGAITTDTWTQNLYSSWLYTLQSLTPQRGQGYPAFMQNEAWQRKQLVTDLGSWTELKHDTLLYAKQVYAERGGGPEELPTGFVEPEPEFYARMAALAAMTRQGLQQRGIIAKEFVDTLQSLEDSANKLRTISEKELSGQKLTDDEVNFIAYWGANIENFTIAAADADPSAGGRKFIDNQDAAVVADVATGIDNVLEEGTGRINLIYVAVQVNGKVILTQGAVYSQYEFTVPIDGRLTDDAWQAQLNSGKAPPLEDWKKSFMADGLPLVQPTP